MPFSTYLREPTPPRSECVSQSGAQALAHSDQACQQLPFQPQQEYSSYGICPPADAMQQYAGRSYYTRRPPLGIHTSTRSIGPSSSSSGSVSSAKPYASPSPLSARDGGSANDGFFQLPSFLMGGFGGTLAPGGGAEVLTPSAMGMFDFVSTPYVPSLAAHASSGKFPSWQTTKYYAIEERHHGRQDDAAASAPPSTHTHPGGTPAPTAASPFGYLNAEAPREQIQDAGAQQEGETMDNDNVLDAVPTTLNAVVSSNEHHCSSALSMAAEHTDALQQPPPRVFVPVPTAGLPVYSQSGFDMLSILARVARRPNQTISLGPVDLTCAFLVADVRLTDAPVVYASQTFCDLTGYTESETLGRNCRFLQSPGGRVVRSEVRRFTSPDAVRELRFALDKDREVQVSLINYRKDGCPFVNRVSVVPIPAEDDTSEIAFHVGFQVDLNEQPGLIVQRIQDGKFYSAGAFGDSLYKSLTPTERSTRGMGKKLRALLADSSFQIAVPLTITCNSASSSVAATNTSNPHSSAPPPSSKSASKPDTRDERQWLHLLMLEHMPDFVHVLSLKGHFLYVSPGITRVLGYAPADFVGKSVGDFCHPSDAVPLLRELKESTGHTVVPSANEAGGTGSNTSCSDVHAHDAQQTHMGQRTVDLLFRMRTKAGGYAWVESIGRLHVEAGKGRKAIVLSGRTCAMPNLRWGAISHAGGILGPSSIPTHTIIADGPESSEVGFNSMEHEFWAMLCEDGLFLVASMGVRDLLGWGAAEMIGRSIREFIVPEDGEPPTPIYTGERCTQALSCRMKRRDGEVVFMGITLYANEPRMITGRIIVQFKFLPPQPPPSTPTSTHNPFSPTYHTSPFIHPFTPSQAHSHLYVHSHATARAHSDSLDRSLGRILHAPTTSVFAEFETHRGTSWQYELQQLKYANDKLREEVGVLEVRQRLQQQRQQQQHLGSWIDNVQA